MAGVRGGCDAVENEFSRPVGWGRSTIARAVGCSADRVRRVYRYRPERSVMAIKKAKQSRESLKERARVNMSERPIGSQTREPVRRPLRGAQATTASNLPSSSGAAQEIHATCPKPYND